MTEGPSDLGLVGGGGTGVGWSAGPGPSDWGGLVCGGVCRLGLHDGAS